MPNNTSWEETLYIKNIKKPTDDTQMWYIVRV